LFLKKNKIHIEKYITGIVNNNDSHLYAIYANPEHAHFLVSRSPKMSEENLASVVAESSQRFINENKLREINLRGKKQLLHFLFQNLMSIKFVNTFLINQNTIAKLVSRKNMNRLLSFIKKRCSPLKSILKIR